MPFTSAASYEIGKKTGGPAIRMSVRSIKNSISRVMFTINKAAADMHLPDAKVGDTVLVQYGTGPEAGTILIALNPNGNAVLRPYGKSAMSASVMAWDTYRKAHHVAKDCEIITGANNSVAIAIPRWTPSYPPPPKK